jgi:AraC-like DNA-binding protein
MLFRDASPCYDQRFFARWQADLEAGQMTVVLMEMKAMFFRFALHPDAVPAAPVADHPDRDHRRASQMAAFMSQHFHEPLTVAEIARTVSLQPNYAMSIFRASFGLSLIAYLTQQRIAYAQQRLIMSDASAADIALEAGYQTLSHFYNAFTRVCGMPPGKYRAALLR